MKVIKAIEEKRQETLEANDAGMTALNEAAPALLRTTDGLFNLVSAIADTGAARRRSDILVSELTAALTEVKDLAQAGIPAHLMRPEVAETMATAALEGANPTLSAGVILALAV